MSEKKPHNISCMFENVSGLSCLPQTYLRQRISFIVSSCISDMSQTKFYYDMQSNAYLKTTQIISSFRKSQAHLVYFCMSQANLSQISGIYYTIDLTNFKNTLTSTSRLLQYKKATLPHQTISIIL